jgi:hypothetical protein
MGNGDLTINSSSAGQAVHRVMSIEPCKPLISDVEPVQDHKTGMRQCTCMLLEVGGQFRGVYHSQFKRCPGNSYSTACVFFAMSK